MDDLIFNSWMTCSQYGGMGMCGGLILTAFATRAIFLPPGFSALNLFQIPMHFVYISLINRLAYDFTICPS